MGSIDKIAFEARGAAGCSSSDYWLRRTSCCDRWCVEDIELGNLYLDPDHLSVVVSLLGDAPMPCPSCGAHEWDLVEVDDLRAAASWHWALSR